MTLTEIEQLIFDQANYSFPSDIMDVNQNGTHIEINDKIPIPVEYVSSDFDRLTDVLIDDESNNTIGVLLFLKGKELQISSLSDYQFAALLIDIPDTTALVNGSHSFETDYVVIDSGYIGDYESKYRNSAPLWGKFNNKFPNVTITSIQTKPISKLVAQEFRGFNNSYYYETAVRGISQISPFERFLKFYHLVELNFDYYVVKKIQSFNISTDVLSVGKVLKEYDKSEFTRLTFLFETYIFDISRIEFLLNQIFPHPAVVQNFLFDFGNDNNPLKNQFLKYQDFQNSTTKFCLSNYISFLNKNATIVEYKTFLSKWVMYIIYRIRCSIAHNKLGEFILTENEKDFVHEFAEPLLLEIVAQLFKN